MADVLTGYTYDRQNGRYRDQSTGRYVSRDNIVKLLDQSVQAGEQRMNALGQAYQDGKIAPATYTVAMRDEVRRQHLQQAALAKGGFDRLTQADYGRAGQALRQLYPKIAGTAADVTAGEVSAAQLKQRHAAYAGSARALYHRTEREAGGPSEDTKVIIEIRILDPDAQHCEDCVTYQTMGWQIAGTLPVPGEDSKCGHHCRCKIRRKEVNYWELDEWLGNMQESMREGAMPWTVDDVDQHNKGLGSNQKKQWVAVANAALKKCQDEGGSNCDASAIKQANAAVANASKEAATTRELHQRLQEAHNCGEWMESRLHLNFTEIADNMFGDGLLTRDERIALSSAIGAALTSFREEVQSAASQLYKRGRWEEPKPSSDAEMEEAGEYASMFVPLVEKAVRRDGTIAIKLIQPGWGATGYYPAEVLERDGPGVFKAGTQMFWDHDTVTEETERPEGSLSRLAAVLATDARWNAQGKAGPGLYADAKVFEEYQKPINELAPHIGVSIRASGRATPGEAEGRKGLIIQGITSAKSSDFVTKPGAGGQILQMFEAARQGRQVQPATPAGENNPMSDELKSQLTEAQGRLTQLEQTNARLSEALLLRDARDYVAGQLATSTLPDVTKARLAESLATNPPVAGGALDKAAYAARIQEAVKAETEYLQKVAGYGSGRIVGMGGTGEQGGGAEFDEAATKKRLAESFQRMGLSEKEAGIAANGRAF